MAFRCDGSPLVEMQRLETMRRDDPQSAAIAVANGKLLVEWARDGRLLELQCAVTHLHETRVLLFYSVRMFRVACQTRRLDILRFMLANGFDLQQACMRDVLHGVVVAIDDDASADAAQPLVRFLLDAGVDVNWQRQDDLYTALHLACRKNLYGIAYLLILYDADVNAIAADDEMPLVSAECMARLGHAATQHDADRNRQLLTLLEDCGARRTWRKTPLPLCVPSQAAPSRPRILSLSAATTHGAISPMVWSCPVSGATEESDGTPDLLHEGLQLDTLPTP